VASCQGASVVMASSLAAFNTGGGVLADMTGAVFSLSCSDLFGNAGGDWTGPIAGLLGTDGNISADPLFCDAGLEDFSLDSLSPCLNWSGCEQIGAFGHGCGVGAAPDLAAVQPQQFRPNIPNPFNPRTQLKFVLGVDDHVDLDILDVSGKRVARLHSGPLGAGRHTVTWEGRDDGGRALPSGIYLARLVTSRKTEHQKITLVR
jgi:hypothetical protein